MFNNRFNSTNKDPLVEAVEGAMKDGNLRREAERLVNEHFGVFSRKAVIRENLAAYDAALEEAYKCMKEGEKWEGSKEDTDEDKKLAKKHGMTLAQWEKSDADKEHDKHEKKEKKKHGKDLDEAKLADKDYDHDGEREPPKDEVWGSRLRAARLAGKLKEEEQIDEISKGLAKRYIKKAEKRMYGGKDDYQIHQNKDTLRRFDKRFDGVQRAEKKLGKKPYDIQFDEDTDYSAQDRAPVTKSAPKEDPSTPKSYPGAASTVKGPNPTSQRMSNALREAVAKKMTSSVTAPQEFKQERFPNKGAVTKAPVPGVSIVEDDQIEEAKYSFKAARAGEDIGKPKKMFKNIAAKAGKKYGSKERGKAVAGAILKRIRAKHMEEQTQIDEIVTKDQLAKSGLSLRDYMNKEKGLTRRDAPSAKPSSWSAPKPVDQSATIKASGGTPAPTSSAPLPPKKPDALTLPKIDKGPAAGPASVPNPTANVPTPPVRPAAPAPAPMQNPDQNRTKVMKEEVQVGTAKYKIV